MSTFGNAFSPLYSSPTATSDKRSNGSKNMGSERPTQEQIGTLYLTSYGDTMEYPLGTSQNASMINDFEEPFIVVRHLGNGSIGFVQEVRVSDKHCSFVRKTVELRGPAVTRRRMLDIMQQEKAIIEDLVHPHIIKIVGNYQTSFHARHRYCLLMEPAGDGDLQSLIDSMEDEPLDTDLSRTRRGWLARWFYCLSSALAFLHERGVRHQDIKPSNIIYRADQVYFTDFSSAAEFKVGHTTSTDSFARTSPLYRAPEARRNEHSDYRIGRASDIFSLGCVFVEMLLLLRGQSIHDFRTDCVYGAELTYSHEVTISRMHQWFDYPSEFDKSYSRSWANIYRRSAWRTVFKKVVSPMLNHDRKERPTAEELKSSWRELNGHRELSCLSPNTKEGPCFVIKLGYDGEPMTLLSAFAQVNRSLSSEVDAGIPLLSLGDVITTDEMEELTQCVESYVQLYNIIDVLTAAGVADAAASKACAKFLGLLYTLLPQHRQLVAPDHLIKDNVRLVGGSLVQSLVVEKLRTVFRARWRATDFVIPPDEYTDPKDAFYVNKTSAQGLMTLVGLLFDAFGQDEPLIDWPTIHEICMQFLSLEPGANCRQLKLLSIATLLPAVAVQVACVVDKGMSLLHDYSCRIDQILRSDELEENTRRALEEVLERFVAENSPWWQEIPWWPGSPWWHAKESSSPSDGEADRAVSGSITAGYAGAIPTGPLQDSTASYEITAGRYDDAGSRSPVRSQAPSTYSARARTARAEPTQKFPKSDVDNTTSHTTDHSRTIASSSEHSGHQSPPLPDRWDQIRKNAAERTARMSENTQSERSESVSKVVDDGESDGEETIESRVARIKARVAELTGNIAADGSQSSTAASAPKPPPASPRRDSQRASPSIPPRETAGTAAGATVATRGTNRFDPLTALRNLAGRPARRKDAFP